MSALACTVEGCGAPLVSMDADIVETCVGFFSPPGHDHDDNCQRRGVHCAVGHEHTISVRRACSACDWKGKEACFCHEGPKVDAWPALPTVEER